MEGVRVTLTINGRKRTFSNINRIRIDADMNGMTLEMESHEHHFEIKLQGMIKDIAMEPMYEVSEDGPLG